MILFFSSLVTSFHFVFVSLSLFCTGEQRLSVFKMSYLHRFVSILTKGFHQILIIEQCFSVRSHRELCATERNSFCLWTCKLDDFILSRFHRSMLSLNVQKIPAQSSCAVEWSYCVYFSSLIKFASAKREKQLHSGQIVLQISNWLIIF